MKEVKEDFYMIPKRLLYAEGFVSTQGECIALSPIDKIVYVVLKERNRYFQSRGDKHFDNQDEIAKMCGTFRKKVGEVIKKYMDGGVVSGKKGFRGSWSYERVSPLVLYGESLREFDALKKIKGNVQTKEKLPKEPVVDFLNDELGW